MNEEEYEHADFKHKQMMAEFNHTGSDGEKKNSREKESEGKRDRHVLRQEVEMLWRRGGRNYEQNFPLVFLLLRLCSVTSVL